MSQLGNVFSQMFWMKPPVFTEKELKDLSGKVRFTTLSRLVQSLMRYFI